MPPAADQMFAEIADDARLGGKARSLARLAAAGLTTPPGFVVTDALFRSLCPAPPVLQGALDRSALQKLGAAADALGGRAFPAGFAAALADRVRALGGDRFAVRSSFADEDQAGALAAGVYESRVGVLASDVPDALRAVLRSALAAAGAAYAQAHQRPIGAPPVAVLVHRHLPGQAQGTAATPESGGPVHIQVQAGALGDEPRRQLEQGLAALALRHGPAEAEWVVSDGQLVFLQLRPFQAPAPPRPWAPLSALGPDPERLGWRWDAAHNPRPLSAAHAGLIEAVDARCRIGLQQRVLGGYLFYRPDPTRLPTAPPDGAIENSVDNSKYDLTTMVGALARDVEAYRAALGPTPALGGALDGFFPLYQRLFGVVQPAARAARRALTDLLNAQLPPAAVPDLLPGLLAGVPSRASERAQLVAEHAAAPPAQRPALRAAYLARFGDEAPTWDIATPTYGEQPDRLVLPSAPPVDEAPRWQDQARAVAATLPPAQRPAFDRRLAAARAAVAAGEDDDWLYARLQAPLRRAVKARGQGLVEQGALAAVDDAFHLPLDWLLAHEQGSVPAEQAASLVTRARAAQQAALADPPPLPDPARAALRSGSASMISGSGTGGRVVGTVVHRHGLRGAAPPADAVLVALSLLPTELPLLQVAALVTETGGPLDHVAAQARERGLPAVVGAAGALARLAEGQLVLVDADRGLVLPLADP